MRYLMDDSPALVAALAELVKERSKTHMYEEQG